MSHMIYKAPVS